MPVSLAQWRIRIGRFFPCCRTIPGPGIPEAKVEEVLLSQPYTGSVKGYCSSEQNKSECSTSQVVRRRGRREHSDNVCPEQNSTYFGVSRDQSSLHNQDQIERNDTNADIKTVSSVNASEIKNDVSSESVAVLFKVIHRFLNIYILCGLALNKFKISTFVNVIHKCKNIASTITGCLCQLYIPAMHLVRSGDIETNPGPNGATQIRTAAKFENLSSPNDMEDIICIIADRLVNNDDLEAFGRKLGFGIHHVERCIKTNMIGGKVTSYGTKVMIRDWRKKNVRKSSDFWPLLKTALLEASLIRLVGDIEEQYPNIDKGHCITTPSTEIGPTLVSRRRRRLWARLMCCLRRTAGSSSSQSSESSSPPTKAAVHSHQTVTDPLQHAENTSEMDSLLLHDPLSDEIVTDETKRGSDLMDRQISPDIEQARLKDNDGSQLNSDKIEQECESVQKEMPIVTDQFQIQELEESPSHSEIVTDDTKRGSHLMDRQISPDIEQAKLKGREKSSITAQTTAPWNSVKISYSTRPRVTRAALGRTARIGALYDIRTDSFLNDTLFSSKLDGDVIDTMDLGETEIEFVKSDSVQEKCNKLDVEAELQVSLLSGMVKVNGSGAYLAEQRKSARAQRMSLIYKLRTINEEIAVRQNKDKIDLGILSGQTCNATHVVVSVDWGANCCITCEYENIENEDATKVEGALNAQLDKLKGLISAKGVADMSFKDNDNEHRSKFTFKCQADVSAPNKDLPVTFEGTVELAQALPKLVEHTNDGKGVPLTYHLMYLENVVKICRSEMKLDIQYKEIREGTVRECAYVLERLSKKRQALYDIHHDMHSNAAFIPDQSLKSIESVLGNQNVEEARFRAELQELVKKVRSGAEDISNLDKMLADQEPEAILASQYHDAIVRFQKDLNKVKLIKHWIRKGVKYIKKGDLLHKDRKQNVFILYKAINCGKDEQNKSQDFFMRLHATHCKDEEYEFIVVDQEILEHIWPSTIQNDTIRQYVNGRLVCRDLYSKEGHNLEMCLIKISHPVHFQTQPKNRAYVQICCPNAVSGSGQCTGDVVHWRCSGCKELIEYGIETSKFYCKCGESKPEDALFRCNDSNHSTCFVSYPHHTLHAKLSRHRAMKEINILILGETGVGKSTWINGFQNYLFFGDLNEAMNSKDFHVLIPSSFTFTQAGEEKEIKVGEKDDNEVLVTGKSATKEPRSYVFLVGGERIRLIDTPGIGDSEGIEQDRKNVDNILSYLTYYDEIHAVCILLKPNNSRLTAMFRFCIQELLVQLHSSAKDNIVFCFTNARATFYQPGDTLPALNKELRNRHVGILATPHNYFCFDNVPFRFLACVKNGVQFTQADIDTYAKSWDKSVEDTKRLLEYINTKLKPHKVKETLGMNEARRKIVALSKPLAEVAKTIYQNVHAAEEAKKQIQLADSCIQDLVKDLTFSGYDLERVKLDDPRTVCAAAACVKFVQVGSERVQNRIYKQICHNNCRCTSGISTQITNDPKVRNCACIRKPSETCVECGHHYTLHMHLTYDTRVIPKDFISQDVQREIAKKGSLKAQKEEAKRVIDTKTDELKGEEKHIMKSAAKFGSFLKANALIPFNDAVEDYLDMTIQQEKMRPREFRNDALLIKMQTMKLEYEQYRLILDNAINTGAGENITTPVQVKELQEELFRLKHFGPTIKRLFDCISITNSARSKAFGETIAPISPRYTDLGCNRRDKRWYQI